MVKKREFDKEKYLQMLRQKLGSNQVAKPTSLFSRAQAFRETLGKGWLGGNSK